MNRVIHCESVTAEHAKVGFLLSEVLISNNVKGNKVETVIMYRHRTEGCVVTVWSAQINIGHYC